MTNNVYKRFISGAAALSFVLGGTGIDLNIAASAEDPFGFTVNYGDIDSSGTIDSDDLVLLQKIVAGWKITDPDIAAADINGDSKIDSDDLVLLQKYVSGWKVVFGPKSYFGGHTYRIIDESLTWEEAKKYCEEIGGHLVTITSGEEELFIEQFIDKYTKMHYYIGLQDDGSYHYTWVTGENFEYNKSIETADVQGSQYTYMVTSNKMEEPFIHVWADHDSVLRGDIWDYTNSGFVCEWDTVIK